MENRNITIIDCATQEIEERILSEEEVQAALEVDRQGKEFLAAEDAKNEEIRNQKRTVLDRLGITEEEAKLLLS